MTVPSTAQLAAATRFCELLNDGDVPGISALLSDDGFVHEYAPVSLGAEACAKKDKARTVELFDFTFKETVQRMGIELPPKQVVHGVDNIMFLVVDNGIKKNGDAYTVEYILIFTFEPGGNKIKGVREYQDSVYVNRQFEGWYQ
ncbi:hypothetical protein EXIGLDRAFT_840836 [Exidia glandulosa HHB12029]|uniref:SnoaL-like domain-containing protein n=1 Tax=Exidia glandulosa HHB12029 TaxID=1314781 RepID=A0A165E8L7_EXIGL|nr:hypothetical protein EXIGLDRAFT_840836 [Exidia glandulosa HHB12029]